MKSERTPLCCPYLLSRQVSEFLKPAKMEPLLIFICKEALQLIP